jgi:hypothetical protein
MATPKSEVITTRVTARDTQVLRSIAALEDVTLSSVASRALRDFATRLSTGSGQTSDAPVAASSDRAKRVSQSTNLRCDCCGDRDSTTNPVTATVHDRLAIVCCEACRLLGIRPRFARRLRKPSNMLAMREPS